jgi:hypothetical protein
MLAVDDHNNQRHIDIFPLEETSVIHDWENLSLPSSSPSRKRVSFCSASILTWNLERVLHSFCSTDSCQKLSLTTNILLHQHQASKRKRHNSYTTQQHRFRRTTGLSTGPALFWFGQSICIVAFPFQNTFAKIIGCKCKIVLIIRTHCAIRCSNRAFEIIFCCSIEIRNYF